MKLFLYREDHTLIMKVAIGCLGLLSRTSFPDAQLMFDVPYLTRRDKTSGRCVRKVDIVTMPCSCIVCCNVDFDVECVDARAACPSWLAVGIWRCRDGSYEEGIVADSQYRSSLSATVGCSNRTSSGERPVMSRVKGGAPLRIRSLAASVRPASTA